MKAIEQPSPPDGVIRRSDLLAAGVSQHTLATRCRPGGPWQRLLPGVLLLANSPPTRRQRLKAAVLYAGVNSIITGIEALHEHGLAVSKNEEVHVLVATDRRITTRDYVRVERTKRLPSPMISQGLKFAPSVRAAVDAARHAQDPAQQRMLLLAPVHNGLRTVDQLRTELDAGSQRGTAALRVLLDEPVEPALTSTVHLGWAQRVLKRLPLPAPNWNVPIYDQSDEQIAIADAWWDEVGLAWDFSNQRDTFARARHTAFTQAGVIVVSTPTTELREDPDVVAEDLTSAFFNASRRPRPPVRTRRAK
jgi:hypothetical protein